MATSDATPIEAGLKFYDLIFALGKCLGNPFVDVGEWQETLKLD